MLKRYEQWVHESVKLLNVKWSNYIEHIDHVRASCVRRKLISNFQQKIWFLFNINYMIVKIKKARLISAQSHVEQQQIWLAWLTLVNYM